MKYIQPIKSIRQHSSSYSSSENHLGFSSYDTGDIFHTNIRKMSWCALSKKIGYGEGMSILESRALKVFSSSRTEHCSENGVESR